MAFSRLVATRATATDARRQGRASLFRSWAGAASMWLKVRSRATDRADQAGRLAGLGRRQRRAGRLRRHEHVLLAHLPLRAGRQRRRHRRWPSSAQLDDVRRGRSLAELSVQGSCDDLLAAEYAGQLPAHARVELVVRLCGERRGDRQERRRSAQVDEPARNQATQRAVDGHLLRVRRALTRLR